jgi:hypothetical protein
MTCSGSSRTWTFYCVLLICILLLIVSPRLLGQHDMRGSDNLQFLDTLFDGIDWWAFIGLAYSPYSLGALGYLNSLDFIASSETPFAISSCLIYGFLYYTPLNLWVIHYLYSSVLLQEIGYFGHILLFFLLAKLPWLRRFILQNNWVS